MRRPCTASKSSPRSLQLEKAPAQPKINKQKSKKKVGIVQQKWKCGKGPKSKIWIWHKWIHRGNKNMGVLTLPPFKKLKIGSQQHHSLSVQFSSVTQSCLTFCNPMNRSTPGFPVHHHLPESTQTHVHRVSDAIQPSHPLSSPSPPAPNPS